MAQSNLRGVQRNPPETFILQPTDWSSFCIILYHLTMLYVNKNRIFVAFLSYFSSPFFNGEEGPNLGIFKELKEFFLGAHKHEAQF